RQEKLAAAAAGLDRQPEAPRARTLYGVVKDSEAGPVPGATVRIALATTGARAVGGVEKANEPTKVTATKPGFLVKTVTAPANEAGKKIVVFLAREEPAAVAVADSRKATATAPPTPVPTPTPRPTPVPTAVPTPLPTPLPTAAPTPTPIPTP